MLALSSRASTRLPCSRRPTARRVVLNHSYVHARPLVVRASAGPVRSDASEAAVVKLTDELRLLETERDDVVKTAEDCARTAVKLEEMVRLLDKLALSKVQEGDEEGARQVLKEKASVQDVLSRTSTRATTNYALASKLAEKIGQQQAEIMDLLAPPGSNSSSSSTVASQPSSSGSGLYSYSRSGGALHSSSSSTSSTTRRPASSNTSSVPTSSPSGSTYSSSQSSSSSSSGGYETPWEKSLRDARQRVAEAEAQAAAAGQAASYKARETLEEARERLRRQALDSVTAARSRIRRSASESIAEAQARIAAEDAAALAEVHKVIDRYKVGGYVSDAELDWAFAQLETRSWRS